MVQNILCLLFSLPRNILIHLLRLELIIHNLIVFRGFKRDRADNQQLLSGIVRADQLRLFRSIIGRITRVQARIQILQHVAVTGRGSYLFRSEMVLLVAKLLRERA